MYKVAFVGNPNVGKTSLYNHLTKSNARIGNWHGVTVEPITKTICLNDHPIEFTDLPGIYSLDSFSKDEEVALASLEQGFDLIVCVINGTQIQKSVYLLTQLLDKFNNLIIAINFADCIQKQGIQFDLQSIQNILGAKCILCSTIKKNGTKELMSTILQYTQEKYKTQQTNSKLLANEQLLQAKIIHTIKHPKNKKNSKSNLTNNTTTSNNSTIQPTPPNTEITQTNLQHKVQAIIQKLDYNTTPKLSLLDKIVLNKFLALPIFLLVIGCIFLLVFSFIGDYSAKFIDNIIITNLNNYIWGVMESRNTPEWIVSLVCDCLVNGVFGIIKFMPGIVALYFFLTILEDSGYTARVAFVTDELFAKFGLSGRSVFTLLLGFGCNTQALCTARNLENRSIQKKVILMTPFVPCSARLPVFVLLASSVFDNSGIIIFALYAIGIFLTVALSGFLQMFKNLKTDVPTVIMELPQYQMPRAKRLWQVLKTNVISFFIRVAGIGITLNIIIWILSNFSATITYVPTNGGISIMQTIGEAIAPIFAPLQFNNWRAIAALIGGIIAKEIVVTSIATLGGTALIIGTSKVTAFAYLLFVLLYTPCVSTLVEISKEIGHKYMWISLLLNNLIAYLVALFFVAMSHLYSINYVLCLTLVGLTIVAIIAIPKVVIKTQQNKKQLVNHFTP